MPPILADRVGQPAHEFSFTFQCLDKGALPIQQQARDAGLAVGEPAALQQRWQISCIEGPVLPAGIDKGIQHVFQLLRLLRQLARCAMPAPDYFGGLGLPPTLNAGLE